MDCNCPSHPESSNREKALDYARGTFSYKILEVEGITAQRLVHRAEVILTFLEGDEYSEQLELPLEQE